MIKRLPLLTMAALGAQACLAAPAASVVDDRGVTVRFDALPTRIVSLSPSLTETVCELGACGRLVGTDRYSNQPVSVRALPKTGGLDDANIEQIAALKPDLVLLTVSSRVTERLEGLGLKVVALEPRSYQDMRVVLGKVSTLLGQGDAGARLWQRLEAQTATAARNVPSAARGMKVYYEVDTAPYAAGEASFIGQTLARLGVKNIVPSDMGPFPKLNPEYIVKSDPQIIMGAQLSLLSLANRPGWERIDAVRRKRICAFTLDQSDVLSRPGPRMGEAAEIMAGCLREVIAKP